MKALFHINKDDKWPALIGTIKNLLKTGKNLEIEILAHDTAVLALKEKVSFNMKYHDDFVNFKDNNISIAVCNNSLNKFDIDKNSILSFVKIVPAGVMEIIEKESEGFNYVKL